MAAIPDSLDEQLGESDSRYEVITCCHSLAPHLAELLEREREILIMRFYDDMTQTQIAARFGISQMHVSRLLTKPLEHLRKVLTTDSPDRDTRNARPGNTEVKDRSNGEQARVRSRRPEESTRPAARMPRTPQRAA